MTDKKVKRKGRVKNILTKFCFLALDCQDLGIEINNFRKNGHLKEDVIDRLERLLKTTIEVCDEYKPKFQKVLDKQK